MEKQAQDKDWLLSRPIAHRGLHDDAIPENSMSAFAAAIDAGCAIEIDVQLTKDKQIVVFHDDFLTRMTGIKKRVTRMTLAALKELRLKGTEETIPTLDEFLEFVAGRVPILVELKRNRGSRGFERIVVDMLNAYGGDFAVQSFNPLAIRKVRRIDPEVYCGLLSSDFSDMKIVFFKKAAIMNARLFFMTKPDFLSFEIKSFPNKRIMGFRENLQMPILGWTIKTQEDIERALKYCDGIIFENIENLKSHLKNIGEFFGVEILSEADGDKTEDIAVGTSGKAYSPTAKA